MHFQRVLFADDFLRTRTNGLTAYPQSRRMIRGLFTSALQRHGVEFAEVCSTDEGGQLDTGALMVKLGLEAGSSGWAAATAAEIPLDAPHLAVFQPDALVIGFGLPKSLLTFLDRRGCSFLDLEIHPIRFTQDLCFRARTNHAGIRRELAAIAKTEEEIWAGAARVQSYCAVRTPGFLLDPKLSLGLFAGQTMVDVSLVEGGAIVSPMEEGDRIRELARSVDVFLIKPHPYQDASPHLLPLYESIPNALWCRDNIYSLFCCSNLAFVSSLSSSALLEAPYFHKRTHQLVEPDRDDHATLPPSCSEWFRVGADLASFGVVARLLGAPATAETPIPPDAIGHALGQRWGLDSIGEQRPAPPTIGFGTYSFASKGNGLPMLASGWSFPEEWGVWSDGAMSTLRFRLSDSDSGRRPLKLTLHANPFRVEQRHVAAVRLRLPGQAPIPIEAEPDQEMFSFTVTPSAQTRGFVEASLETLNPKAPADLGLSADPRRLGIGLHAMALEPA